jgi:hypothetical protein
MSRLTTSRSRRMMAVLVDPARLCNYALARRGLLAVHWCLSCLSITSALKHWARKHRRAFGIRRDIYGLVRALGIDCHYRYFLLGCFQIGYSPSPLMQLTSPDPAAGQLISDSRGRQPTLVTHSWQMPCTRPSCLYYNMCNRAI